MGKIKIFWFCLYLLPPETGGTLSNLIRWMKKDSLVICRNLDIIGTWKKDICTVYRYHRQNLKASHWHGFSGLERHSEGSMWDSYWKVPVQPILKSLGTYLVVQWLRLCVSPAGSVGSVPGQGTKMSQATQCSIVSKSLYKQLNLYK